MALQFPSDPASVGNVYEAPNGVIYYYDGTKWSGHGVPANVSLAEAAQDATAAMLAAGVKTNIAVTYHDDTNAMDLTVTLPTATDTILGGVKVGNNLSITNGVLSATSAPYTLPTATDTILGGVKVGNNLTIANGVLSASAQSPEVSIPVGNANPPTVLDQTKQIYVLGTGTYRLTNGTEGQICYFVMHSTGSATGSVVNVDNIRVITSDVATIATSAVWRPFDVTAGADSDAKTTATAIFTEGAWNVSNGLVNP
jgi:hypothetical protein